MRESSEHISFIQPHIDQTEQPTEAQITNAAGTFPEVLKDAMLAQAGELEIVEFTTRPNKAALRIHQEYDDGSHLDVGLYSEEAAIASSDHNYRLMIHDYPEGTQNPHTLYQYSLPSGATEVIRSDYLPLSATEREARSEEAAKSTYRPKPAEELSPEDLERLSSAAGEAYEKIIRDKAFEREIGTNHLPVGADEIQRIRDLIESLQQQAPPTEQTE